VVFCGNNSNEIAEIGCFPAFWKKTTKEFQLIFQNETYRIREAIFEVNREMGSGFLEHVYQECLITEFQSGSIPFVSQPRIRIRYKDHALTQPYIPDFICYGKIIVEIKSVRALLPEHQAQILNYLKATRLEVGLLANFGGYPKAEIQRFVSTAGNKQPRTTRTR